MLARVRVVLVSVLGLGALVLVAAALSASAAPGVVGISPSGRLPWRDDSSGFAISLTDALTETLYLPLALSCYGPCGVCEHDGQGGTEVITMSSSSCVATKIRIDLGKRTTGYGFSLWEVEAYGPDDPQKQNNLVSGGMACASSVERDLPLYYGPCLAIDGLMSTRWASEWYEPQWLEITLPETGPKFVKYVVLEWETASATDYQVSVINTTDTTCRGISCFPGR
jgi:hypothetical protein